MLKDITIGQYFPGNSVIHRMDSRFKLILSMVYVVMLFISGTFISLLVCCVFIFMAYVISGIHLRLIWKSIKPVLPLIAFTSILNLFFINGEQLIVDIGITKIYWEGVRTAGFMLTRIVALIVGMGLLTYTTSPIMLTDALESLLGPLKKIRFPVHELAMMMTIALRFIPTLIDETDKIMAAQKARGATLDSGNLMQKAKALVPILIPLFVSAFKRAYELATAMECRCYRGGEGRTRLKQLKSSKLDYLVSGIVLCTLGFIIVNNMVFG